jgi:haloacetate dehalogenase
MEVVMEVVTEVVTKDHLDQEESLERRSFLGALTGASLSFLSEGAFTEFAKAQNTPQAGTDSTNRTAFEMAQVEVSGNTVFPRRYGKGPAILLVHGFPRTSLMWRFLAPNLAENHTVIGVDLRAYGRSGIAAFTDNHSPYSKRAMAKELVDVMDKLGFPPRSRRARLLPSGLDHRKNVERLAVFDVIPIFEAWNRSNARFAQTRCRRATCSVLPRPSSRTPRARFLRNRDSRPICLDVS